MIVDCTKYIPKNNAWYNSTYLHLWLWVFFFKLFASCFCSFYQYKVYCKRKGGTFLRIFEFWKRKFAHQNCNLVSKSEMKCKRKLKMGQRGKVTSFWSSSTATAYTILFTQIYYLIQIKLWNLPTEFLKSVKIQLLPRWRDESFDQLTISIITGQKWQKKAFLWWKTATIPKHILELIQKKIRKKNMKPKHQS